MKFKARTDNQRKLDTNWDMVNHYVARWQPGTYLDIEITRRVAKKSDPLRRYYFSTVLPLLSRHLGYEQDEDLEVHKQLKIRYYKIEPDGRGVYRNIPKVFSNESEIDVPGKVEFVEYVKRQAGKNGCYIPDANEG